MYYHLLLHSGSSTSVAPAMNRSQKQRSPDTSAYWYLEKKLQPVTTLAVYVGRNSLVLPCGRKFSVAGSHTHTTEPFCVLENP